MGASGQTCAFARRIKSGPRSPESWCRALRGVVPAALAAALFCVVPAHAQTFPTKPIRIIVPFAPGGGTDIIARLIAQKLADAWGHQVVVDNRAGGGTVIGTELVAKSAADGYTLLLTANPHTTNAALNHKLPYDTLRDFAPVTMVASAPLIIVVHPSLPARSINELIAVAKARPRQLSYGSSGNGGPQHIAGELFKSMSGIDMLHIPYKGSAPATTDLLGGQVQVGFASMLTVLPFVKAGRLRPLAVTSIRRSAIMPDLPSVDESGLPGYEATTWYGVFAPAGAPRVVVTALNAEIARALKLPEIKDRLAKEGSDVVANDPAAFAAFLQTEIERLRKLATSSGIKLD